MASDSKTIVLITGANTGIGLAVVKALCQSSIAYMILLGSRSVDKGNEAAAAVKNAFPNTKSEIQVVQIDIVSDDQIENLLDLVFSKYGKLDVLINNAGANFDSQIKYGDLRNMRAKWNESWNVNVASTQVMTEAFAPLLLKSDAPRLLFLTSGTACLTETGRTDIPILERINAPPPAGWPKETLPLGMSYRSTKTGLNMMMREWWRILNNDGVKVWAISPGFLATGLGGSPAEAKKSMGAGDAQVGGDFIRDVVEGARDADMGLAIRSNVVQDW